MSRHRTDSSLKMGARVNSLDDICRQRYLEEIFNKERDKRLNWYFKTAKERSQNGDQRSKQIEVMSRKLEAACPKPTEELIRLREKRRNAALAASVDKTVADDTKLPDISRSQDRVAAVKATTSDVPYLPLVDMNRADTPTKQKLYDGLSKEGKGRHAYLASRHKLDPDNKFNFPLLSSWEYGWRLSDVIRVEDLKNPTHGRSRIIAETFYRNNGLSEIAKA